MSGLMQPARRRIRRIVSMAVVVAMGVGETGQHEVMRLATATRQKTSLWRRPS